MERKEKKEIYKRCYKTCMFDIDRSSAKLSETIQLFLDMPNTLFKQTGGMQIMGNIFSANTFSKNFRGQRCQSILLGV